MAACLLSSGDILHKRSQTDTGVTRGSGAQMHEKVTDKQFSKSLPKQRFIAYCLG